VRDIHFIGGGKMAEAMIRALIANQTVPAGQISVTDVDKQRIQLLSETYGIRSNLQLEEALAVTDFIVIAVRPQDDLPSLGKLIRQFAARSAVVLSIIAGVTIETLERYIDDTRPIIRVIPNTLTDTGLGYSGAALNRHASKEQVDEFLQGFGKVQYIDESLIDIFTGFGVAGPNYIYYFIESLADAGVLAGLPRDLTWQVTLENVAGSVAMLQQTGLHPRQLLDINNSAGGVGIHALYELNNCDLAAGLQRSVLAAVKRTTELGEGR
jgi:pyrroline-5-carboxylate reductase